MSSPRIPVGSAVRIDSPKTPRWHDEEGIVVAHAGTSDEPLYVVHVAGWQPLFITDALRILEEAPR